VVPQLGVWMGDVPVQLCPVPLTRLLILPRQLVLDFISILVLFVTEVCLLHFYHALALILDPEVVLVHHADGQVDAVLFEVYDQCVTVEVALVVFVHLDPLIAVRALVDDAILLELFFDFGLIRVAWEVADVDRAVLLDFRLFVGLMIRQPWYFEFVGSDVHLLLARSCASC
jgi:hypothetical protein